MKNILLGVLKFLIFVVIIFLGILLILKIKDDTIKEKNNAERLQNIKIESEYVINNSNKLLSDIKKKIEDELNVKVELADVGSISDIDIYFVTLVNNEYKNIILKQVDGKEKFEIAEDNYADGKYIVGLNAIELEELVYTNIENYSVDKEGKITYINN